MNSSSENETTPCRVFETSSSAFLGNHLSGALFTNQVTVFVVNIILIMPTLLLNAASIVTILKSSQLRSKPCYFIILLQSAADLAVGALGTPLFLVYLSRGIGGISNCLIAVVACRLSFTTFGVSLITFFGMTLERYIAIIHPFAYDTKVTNNKILVAVSVAATVSMLLLGLSVIILRSIEIVVIVIMALLFTFTTFAYTRIYVVVLKKTNQQNFVHDVNDERNLRKRFFKEIKKAKSCFLVVICYSILGFVPLTLLLVLKDQQAVENWLITLCTLNSSANSVIFFWTKTMLRREAVKTLKSFYSHNV